MKNVRFRLVMRLCRYLATFYVPAGDNETWHKQTDHKDGSQEFEFYIKVRK